MLRRAAGVDVEAQHLAEVLRVVLRAVAGVAAETAVVFDPAGPDEELAERLGLLAGRDGDDPSVPELDDDVAEPRGARVASLAEAKELFDDGPSHEGPAW